MMRIKVLLLAVVVLLSSLAISGSVSAKAPKNALQGQFHLSHVVKLYVPGTINQSDGGLRQGAQGGDDPVLGQHRG